MGVLQEKDKEYLRNEFSKLKNDVRLILFTQEDGCTYCSDEKMLMDELSSLSPKIKVEYYDYGGQADKKDTYKVDKFPALIIEGAKDYGIRYYGIPAGYEFASVIEDIMDVSQGTTNLSDNSKTRLKAINRPVRIQVFVTPSCPYCPKAVRTAHKIAIENEFVTADMVEATEFPDISNRYSVQSVPKIVVNDDVEFVGALPEDQFVDGVLSALEQH
ncbi:MAG: thioredoxin family protein [Deltaproteobacteria bacterium]|nr:thioredoxin family protein [Deltaproteobacteria bacterium]MCL5276779.1 thioredoxin family protein [Deltaproteobacteria bacterium]